MKQGTPPQPLESRFCIDDPAQVLAFLGVYPSLQLLLWEAVVPIERQFGSVPLSLAMSYEPEGGVDPSLVLSIITDLGAEQALERLDRLDADWWLDAAFRSDPGGKLCITLGWS